MPRTIDEEALRSGTDPDYAPCLDRSKMVWRAPKKYVAKGYSPRWVRLDPEGDYAAECRELTLTMLMWMQQQEASGATPGTWQYVIDHYRSDAESPYQEVKANTREVYDYLCDRWAGAIGKQRVATMDFRKVKQIERAMKDKGRTVSNIHRMFTMLRTLASYGKLLKVPGADDVKDTLSEMKFRTPVSRDVAPTRAQVMAVVAAADATDSLDAFIWATGILIQYELILRAVDVRGQWFDISEQETRSGGITRTSYRTKDGKRTAKHSRWQDGLTWEMFDDDLTRLEKVISKTERSMPHPYTFDLTGLPEIRQRLLAIRPEAAVGPVIVTTRHKLPWDRHAWSNAWRRHAKAAGLPPEIQMRDTRAGGITEARAIEGLSPFDIRDAGQHANVSTTSGYARGRSDAANKVVAMRRPK